MADGSPTNRSTRTGPQPLALRPRDSSLPVYGSTLPGVHLNSLRHAAASVLLAAGVHTEVVQAHLGHSSYAPTADIHSHVAPQQSREAADHLDRALDWSTPEDPTGPSQA